MKETLCSVVRALPVGSHINVADNSGARRLRIIGVRNYKGVKSRRAAAAIADIVIGVVEVGKPDMKQTMVNAVIIRSTQPYGRPDGTKIRFHDNACILLKDLDEYAPKGTMIKGPVAREVIRRFPPIAKIASVVV